MRLPKNIIEVLMTCQIMANVIKEGQTKAKKSDKF
jgi:hypothetical protein